MSIRSKLMLANGLMLVGIIPLGLCLVWVVGFLSWLSGADATIPNRFGVTPLMRDLGSRGNERGLVLGVDEGP